MLKRARARAEKSGMVFELNGADAKAKLDRRVRRGKCELTGLPFHVGAGLRWDSPSLDRIDAAKGYRYDNVRVILHGMNTSLGSWGETVLARMWTAYMKNRKAAA